MRRWITGMGRPRRPRGGAVLALLLAVLTAPARAASTAHDVGNFLSGAGNLTYLGVGAVLPALTDHVNGTRRSLRVVDAVATATAAAEILKLGIHERRPDNSHSTDSFPSGHATAVFALASNLSEYYPHQAPYWYLGAAAIGWSRVEVRAHHTTDVLAGAALGYWVGKVEARSRHGLLLGPVYSAAGVGLGLAWRHGW